MTDVKEIKVQTKEWANPTPAGLAALAVACICFFAMFMGYVDVGKALPLLGCWLIGGFVIQITVAFLDLKGGNYTGGNTFLFFSAFFMLATGMGMFCKFFFGGDVSANIEGWAWLILTLVLVLWTPAFFKPFGILSLIVVALDIAIPIVALRDLGVLSGNLLEFLTLVAAVMLLIAALLAVYLSAAMVVNKAFGREIYPVIKPKN